MVYDRIRLARGQPLGASFSAILGTGMLLTVPLHGVALYPFTDLLRFYAGVTLVPWLAEALGLRTGFPFGRYQYTLKMGRLGPAGVPWAVIGMWPLLLYFSQGCSSTLTKLMGIAPSTGASPVIAIAAIALFATLIDLLLEPLLTAGGYWVWVHPLGASPRPSRHLWAGIPASNFFGWFGVAAIAVTVAGAPLSQHPHTPLLQALPFLWGGVCIAYLAGTGRNAGFKIFPWALGVVAAGFLAVFLITAMGAGK